MTATSAPYDQAIDEMHDDLLTASEASVARFTLLTALSLAAFVALLPFAICTHLFTLTGILFLWLALACIAFNLAICWEHRKNAVAARDQLLTKSNGHSQERDPSYYTV